MQVRQFSHSYLVAELNMKFWFCTVHLSDFALVKAASSPSTGHEISASFSHVVIVLKASVFRTLG